MRPRKISTGSLWAALLAEAWMAVPAQAAQPVLQRGYDANVSGANLTETILNTSNVSPSTFGMVFKLPVDDNVFAQPLYVPNVIVGSQGVHDVVYVATMSDTLYAFDADTGAPLWSVNFATLVDATPVPIAKFVFAGNKNIVGNLGILSTPVIDPTTKIMYLVACTLEKNALTYRLHAVDITTGTEPYGPGVVISGSSGGSTFDARYQIQRVSLVLSGKTVVFGFAAIELEYAGGYTGWMMAYDKQTLTQTGIIASARSGTRGAGIWMSGRPPAVDSSGYAYVYSGNGYSSGYDGVNNFSESVLKLDPSHGLKLVDWFTPSNWSFMDGSDLDLSSSGPLLIPGTALLAGGGKTGMLYLLNSANLGKYDATDKQIPQKEQITNAFRGGPVYWQRSTAAGGPLLFNWGVEDSIKAYAFNGSTLATSPSFQGSGYQIWPGGVLTLSANGSGAGSGVLWATVVVNGDAEDNPPVPGELHAFNAANVSQELWNSAMNPARDAYGYFGKLVPPVVANGRVYVATWSDQVAVYGILAKESLSATSLAFGNAVLNATTPAQVITVKNIGTIPLPLTSITLSNVPPHPFAETTSCASLLAVGATCAISVTFNPQTAGAKTAAVTIKAGNGAGTQTVKLTGTGVIPTYTVAPTSLAFGTAPLGVPSPPQVVTVTNTGTLALPLAGITLSNVPPHPFSYTTTCASSVAVGAPCTISVVFNPQMAGAKSALLGVNVGGGAGNKTVALSGTGQ